jgi:type VI secretion system protein ImpH
VGDRVWDIRGKFRLRLGPLTYPQFRRLLPDGDLMEKVRQLSRIYVGTELDFDAQLVLPPPATPQCRLGYEDFEPRLGWNLWLGDAGQGDEHDAAIFTAADGL